MSFKKPKSTKKNQEIANSYSGSSISLVYSLTTSISYGLAPFIFLPTIKFLKNVLKFSSKGKLKTHIYLTTFYTQILE